MKYSMQNEFAIRTPLLPLENNEVLTKSKEPSFKEALCVSSISLFDSYNKGDLSEEQKIKIEKYRKRMSNRATPFGLAATQSFTRFQNNTMDVERGIRLGKLKKFIRPDMEWLNDVINMCEKQVFRNLKVIFVNDCEIVRDKLINIWHRNNQDTERSRDKVQINHTFAVKKVIELARNYTQIEVIIKELMSTYPEVEEVKIINFLQELLDKGYLWSDLRCYFFGNKQFELFLEKLNSYKMKSELNGKLKEIQLLMEEYNRTEIGEGTGLIKIIQGKMKSIVSKKRCIHIDSTRDIDSCKLDQTRINEDLTGFLEFLSQHTFKLSAFRTSNVVNSFIEKYGDTEVPLKIFTDENNLEQLFEDNYMLQEEINIRKEIENLIEMEKMKGEKIVDLEKLSQRLEIQSTEGELPIFSELPVSITSRKGTYTYHLNPYLRSIEHGKIAGRFLYMDKIMQEKYRESFNKVEKVKDVMMIEPVFFPKLDLIGNVFHSPIYSQQINYFACGESGENGETSEPYDLNDILIGVHADKLYFKSRKYNKRVHFINRNSANTKFFPKLIRFLFLYSENFYESPFELLELLDSISETNIYMPRVIYKNIIIRPEQWDVSLALPLGGSKEKFKLEFKNIVNK
ncbi:lantibiotic dehydratase, partial [Listeria monocytogenes]|nr:lantibiotic dehydratase [Listeria monocytogenes]